MLLTYTVLAVEATAFAFFPFYLGKAVDGIFAKNWLWFGIYLGVCIIGCTVGTFRQMFDTRVFGSAWRKISCGVVNTMMARKMDTSKVITRAGMSTRFVDFFEYAVPQIVRAGIGVIIALCMLQRAIGGLVWWLALLCAGKASISLWVSYREQYWDHKVTDSNDSRNEAIEARDMAGVDESYKVRILAYIKQSDWGAFDWLQGVLFGVAGEVVVIVGLTSGTVTPGEVLAAVGYVWNLFGQVMVVSYFFGALRSVEVARERIAEGTEDE